MGTVGSLGRGAVWGQRGIGQNGCRLIADLRCRAQVPAGWRFRIRRSAPAPAETKRYAHAARAQLGRVATQDRAGKGVTSGAQPAWAVCIGATDEV